MFRTSQALVTFLLSIGLIELGLKATGIVLICVVRIVYYLDLFVLEVFR